MNGSDFGRVLLINKSLQKNIQELIERLLLGCFDVVSDNDLGTAIHRAQTNRFDVIVLDANIQGMPIERIIQILKDIGPESKIIVKTDVNTKELEAKVRKEEIYYYHLDSFGVDDLKLAIESAIIQKSKKLSSEKSNAVARKLVLMVDENENFIEIHKTNLENHNYVVDVCYNADEAIRKIKTKQPDLIMVDMGIPVGSAGLHFMEMLMNEQNMKKIPVLIFISKTKLEKYEKILDRVKSALPTWTYLEKPVKIEDVIPKVEALIVN